MKSSLDNLIAYINSTADSDQSGDYDGMRVGEKRSFEDFIAAAEEGAGGCDCRQSCDVCNGRIEGVLR